MILQTAIAIVAVAAPADSNVQATAIFKQFMAPSYALSKRLAGNKWNFNAAFNGSYHKARPTTSGFLFTSSGTQAFVATKRLPGQWRSYYVLGREEALVFEIAVPVLSKAEKKNAISLVCSYANQVSGSKAAWKFNESEMFAGAIIKSASGEKRLAFVYWDGKPGDYSISVAFVDTLHPLQPVGSAISLASKKLRWSDALIAMKLVPKAVG